MRQMSTVKKLLGGVVLLLASSALFNVMAVAQPPAQSSAPTPEAVDPVDKDAGAESEPLTNPPVNQPFEDYEASEQISEDLSVAFPVDI